MTSLGHRTYTVFLPSGRGTTSHYLRQHLGDHVRVLTCPAASTPAGLRASQQQLVPAGSSAREVEIIDTKQKLRWVVLWCAVIALSHACVLP